MQPKTELGQGITKDSIDSSAGETFEFLCKMAGTPVDRNSAMPFDGPVPWFRAGLRQQLHPSSTTGSRRSQRPTGRKR